VAFFVFFPGNHGEIHPKREKYGRRVEKMVMAMMIIGVWGCPKIKKSGTPKTVAVQKMHHSVAHCDSTGTCPLDHPKSHWFPLVSIGFHWSIIIFPSKNPIRLSSEASRLLRMGDGKCTVLENQLLRGRGLRGSVSYSWVVEKMLISWEIRKYPKIKWMIWG